MKSNDFILKIKKENIVHNYKYLKKIQNKEIIAVVKANAYGLDLKEIVKILYEQGCRYFGVTRILEVEDILKLGFKEIKILILEKLEDLNILKKYTNIEMIVDNIKTINRIIENGIDLNQIHIKLDFGFGRNGIEEKNFNKLIKFIKSNNLRFKGICTHLFDAEKLDMLSIEKKFYKMVDNIGKDRFEMIHIQNSAGIISIKGERCTHIRCGTMLFGFQEIGYYDKNIKRSCRFIGGIIGIKNLENLKYIGYRNIKDIKIGEYTKIAKIRLGYGDGFSKRGEGLMSIINNKKYEIVHISMDFSFILVDTNVSVGDRVEIFYDFDKAMKLLKVPHYEFICCLNRRIKREII